LAAAPSARSRPPGADHSVRGRRTRSWSSSSRIAADPDFSLRKKGAGVWSATCLADAKCSDAMHRPEVEAKCPATLHLPRPSTCKLLRHRPRPTAGVTCGGGADGAVHSQGTGCQSAFGWTGPRLSPDYLRELAAYHVGAPQRSLRCKPNHPCAGIRMKKPENGNFEGFAQAFQRRRRRRASLNLPVSLISRQVLPGPDLQRHD